jgi:hypothetical protein
LYLSLLRHREALKKLKEEAKQAREDFETLKNIMKELSENYNPNYQVGIKPRRQYVGQASKHTFDCRTWR